MNRTMARARAMKLVYEWEMGGDGGEDTRFDLLGVQPGEEEADYMEHVAAGVAEKREEIDQRIAKHSRWPLERLSRVDLAILRVAVYEAVFLRLPAAPVVSAAVELAERYSTDKSTTFVNGVLGAILRGERP